MRRLDSSGAAVESDGNGRCEDRLDGVAAVAG